MVTRRVTLADVARAAGVSSTTASLVLSGRGSELRISQAVQERVRDASAELGYRPNIVSVGLRKGTTRTLGLVSDTVATGQMAGDMVKGAIETARDHGFMLFIGETEGDPDIERTLIDAMQDRRVDGIMLTSMFTRTREVPPALERVPTVLLNTLPAGPTRAPAVVPDEVEAGRAAARLLLDAGHRDIHLVGAGPDAGDVPPDTVAGVERLAGIREVLHAAGLEPASSHLCDDWTPPQGWAATHDLLAHHPRPRAVICFNDRLAFGTYQALQESGLRIPDDVSVVSFDNYPMADWLRPGVSSFAIPHEQLGRRAVELLLAEIAGAGDGPAVHRLPLPLHTRGSVAPV
ncbi:LacI family DNA-binding transcriptional regulator [Cellulomonas xiejunii]|uniref:LacI family DNA-binding transcriptional regulator n=1 Tax=Cellulomonas xiejunii TaxID=2968083 RepID=A0ABY5KQ42_9CELL|nr:LacI family DNA-binding transcriptional regulator [Cellulomonas xiejunii]MCC2314119.1 LacI family DNA-binding transcriptional regulator [Cellulomonas xiejunii]MCC2323495.1 LacI family DNA-binding transcriptional regulator [Cellulomonas xiejunii]UUI71576.1 LacI family DNA-binding transcriptional regulator [Cellulomonas xiejunii]